MMSVLLTFFIVLQAFSTISERKFQMAVESIREAFSVPLPVTSPGAPSSRTRETTAEELQESISEENVEGISVEDFGDRLVVTVETGLLFPIGDATLLPQGREVMGRVAHAVRDTRGKIRIEGHTCDLQLGPGSAFPDNWWLSSARAMSVLETLRDNGVPARRLSAAGFGEFDPVAPNDGEANRGKNRRVEIVIEKSDRPADAS
jgi:chemotaxis protein MotB